MNKKLIVGVVILILIGLGVYLSPMNRGGEKTFEARNMPLTVESKPAKYFGNEAKGDLNGDGLPDTAFLVTQEPGGSGTFYYVMVALNSKDGYKLTNAVFVGDRISPQSTEIHSDSRELHVNYADRNPGEPMTTKPSLGKVLILKVSTAGLLEA